MYLDICIYVYVRMWETRRFWKNARGGTGMLGGWVNPHREQQTIPQGQTSITPKSFSTPTANG